MLDLIILLAILGLVATVIWLYLSTEKIEAKMDVNASALPHVSFRTYLIPVPTKSKLLYRRIKELSISAIRSVLRFGMVILPLTLVAIAIYLVLTTTRNTFLTILIGVVGLLGFVLFVLSYYKRRPDVMFCPPLLKSGKRQRIKAPPRIVRYNGVAHIPIRVYEGDSYNITVDLRPSIRKPLESVSSIRFQRMKDKDDVSLNLNVLRHSGQQEFLELEMLAAGFTVEGDKKQKQVLTADSLRYQWNCFFENSGNHTFAVAFRVISGSDVSEIGRVEQSIRVVKIDHLTQRQVWVLASVAGILSGGLAILEVMRKLGFW
jgi:hypothetical protein